MSCILIGNTYSKAALLLSGSPPSPVSISCLTGNIPLWDSLICWAAHPRSGRTNSNIRVLLPGEIDDLIGSVPCLGNAVCDMALLVEECGNVQQNLGQIYMCDFWLYFTVILDIIRVKTYGAFRVGVLCGVFVELFEDLIAVDCALNCFEERATLHGLDFR